MIRLQVAAMVIGLMTPASGYSQSLDPVGFDATPVPIYDFIQVAGMGLTPCPAPKDGRCPDTVIMPTHDILDSIQSNAADSSYEISTLALSRRGRLLLRLAG
jgi:hypothetical protein